jgi:hypothetical protein
MKNSRVAAALASVLTTFSILYAVLALFAPEPVQISRAQAPTKVAAAASAAPVR